MVNVGASGQIRIASSVGEGISPGASLGPTTPAFWSFVLLALLVVAILAIAHSLR